MAPSSRHLLLAGLSTLHSSCAFVPTTQIQSVCNQATGPLFALSTEEEKKSEVESEDKDFIKNNVAEDSEVEGLPWWWELVWKLDIMKKGEEGEPIIFGDSANVLRTNIEQIYGGFDSLDGCPLAGTKMFA